MTMALDALIRGFNGHVAFRECRPGVLLVSGPLFHEDGDMVGIFLGKSVSGSGKVRICDHPSIQWGIGLQLDFTVGEFSGPWPVSV